MALDGPPYSNRKWLIAAYIIAGLLVFVAFLIADFPYAETASALLVPYQLKLVYQAEHLAPPLGARLEDVQLISFARGSDEVLLRSSNLELTPTFASLFFGEPGVAVRADIYDGKFSATVRRRGDIADVNFSLSDLKLGESRALRQLVESFSGDISGAGSAELHGSEVLANTVRLTLVGDGLALRVIQGAPVVHLGSVAGQLRLDGAVLTVERLSAHGGDVELNGGGVIRFAPALQNSTVELKLHLHPSASGQAHFGLFFNLLPHPPAEGPYYVSGCLASPSIN